MWAMKLNQMGQGEAGLKAQGYEKVDGSHYASDSIAADGTNPITVQIVLVMYCVN
jgi:hypothetical protein